MVETYNIFKDLAIIIIAAKIFGILARKCKAPQVVGEIVAGLIIYYIAILYNTARYIFAFLIISQQ